MHMYLLSAVWTAPVDRYNALKAVARNADVELQAVILPECDVYTYKSDGDADPFGKLSTFAT